VLKHGTNLGSVILSNGIKVNAVFASDVDYIVLKHVDKRIRSEIFSLQPKEFTFKAKFLKPKVLQTKGDEREFPIMKGKQIPLIINDATTGHKLQESGVNNLFVHSWSYVTNWAYVMLSRVETKKYLYMRKPLSRCLRKYAVPPVQY